MGSSPCACVSGFEFRRVKFAKYKPDGKFYTVKPRAEIRKASSSLLSPTVLFARFRALRFMKKHEIIKLKQVDHINNEKRLMAQIAYPFIVNMPASQFSGWAIAEKIILSTLQLGSMGPLWRAAFVKVMESINGGELFTHLRRARKFSDEQSKFYALQVRR
ncbi:cAMP-dependent protein kinase type 3 [Symbiodinium microadriaticum]|uniref:cAMP-dependent protein kinase type 3 n=1 Tax=Symbiodinium microadriaticum TaxID=2951 RepID=A0A1Q9BZK6_SYMMI|nr:cAMP-dependent protein kinase type 3 [Symbiodinium microadriaticum]